MMDRSFELVIYLNVPKKRVGKAAEEQLPEVFASLPRHSQVQPARMVSGRKENERGRE